MHPNHFYIFSCKISGLHAWCCGRGSVYTHTRRVVLGFEHGLRKPVAFIAAAIEPAISVPCISSVSFRAKVDATAAVANIRMPAMDEGIVPVN